MQKAQDENDFHSELAATVANSQRQWQAGRTGEIANIVSQVDGFAIDNSPRGLEAMVKAPVVINVWRKNFNRITDEMFFGFTAFSTVRIPTTLFVGILTTEFVAVETVIFLEDRLLRRLGIDLGRQQGFQSLYSLYELLVLI